MFIRVLVASTECQRPVPSSSDHWHEKHDARWKSSWKESTWLTRVGTVAKVFQRTNEKASMKISPWPSQISIISLAKMMYFTLCFALFALAFAGTGVYQLWPRFCIIPFFDNISLFHHVSLNIPTILATNISYTWQFDLAKGYHGRFYPEWTDYDNTATFYYGHLLQYGTDIVFWLQTRL